MKLIQAFKSLVSHLNPFMEDDLTVLNRACQKGDLIKVNELFKKKTLRISPIPVQSILTTTVMHGNIEVLHYLLTSPNTKAFQNPNISLEPILRSSAIHGNTDIILYFLTLPDANKFRLPDNKENIVLDYLSQLLHFEIIDCLIKSPLFKDKIDLHTNDDILFVQAFNNHKDELLDYLIFERQLDKTSKINNFLNNPDLHNQNNPYLNQVKHLFEVRNLNKALENELTVNKGSNQKRIKV